MTALFTRRGLLGVGAVVGVGASAGGASAFTPAVASASGPVGPATLGGGVVAATAPHVDPDRPQRSLFVGREGTVYRAVSTRSVHRMTLVGVGDIGSDGDPAHRFRLEFTTDDAARDDIYRLEYEGTAVARLYLGRVTRSARFEAVIDRGVGA